MADKTNQQKLDDLWWILCADDGRKFLQKLVADGVLDDPTPLPGGGTTSLRTKDTYQKQEFNVLGAKADAQAEQLKTISGQLAQLITLLTPKPATK